MLVFDADDTLWENNIHFERVVDDYLGWLAHPSLDEAAIRAVMRDIESANVRDYGYGSQVFLRTLHDVFERLYERPISESERLEVARLAVAVIEHQVELMPEAAATLQTLRARHRLALVTKGTPAEQQRKIDASGLAAHFSAIRIVAEKTPDTYRRLTGELGLDPQTTWMIGNSPKSDIVAARQADWNAVFIPHPHTWAHEDAEIDTDDPRILTVANLAELVAHF